MTPWKPPFGGSLPADPSLDAFRNSVARLMCGSRTVGYIAFRADHSSRLVRGHLWWREWAMPKEVVEWMQTMVDGSDSDDVTQMSDGIIEDPAYDQGRARGLAIVRPMYRGLLLDVYGTLVHEDDDSLQAICAHVGELAGVEPGAVAKEWGRRFQDACRAAHGDAFRLQRDLNRETLAETMRHFDVRGDAEDHCRPQFDFWRSPALFADSLPFLQQAGVPVCVVSNIDRADVQAALDLHRLPVDAVVTSEDARAYKPRPEPFELALHTLGLQADEVLHVGDSPSADIGGAGALGMDTAWINRKGRRTPGGCEPTFTAGSLHGLSVQLHLS